MPNAARCRCMWACRGPKRNTLHGRRATSTCPLHQEFQAGVVFGTPLLMSGCDCWAPQTDRPPLKLLLVLQFVTHSSCGSSTGTPKLFHELKLENTTCLYVVGSLNRSRNIRKRARFTSLQRAARTRVWFDRRPPGAASPSRRKHESCVTPMGSKYP